MPIADDSPFVIAADADQLAAMETPPHVDDSPSPPQPPQLDELPLEENAEAAAGGGVGVPADPMHAT